jgi:hypothetical protein
MSEFKPRRTAMEGWVKYRLSREFVADIAREELPKTEPSDREERRGTGPVGRSELGRRTPHRQLVVPDSWKISTQLVTNGT